MTARILLFALALFAAPPVAWADPIFQCAGAKTGQIEAVCLDRELVGLDRTAAARFDAVVAQADP